MGIWQLCNSRCYTHLGHDELVQLLAVLQLGVAVEKKGGVILCGLSLPENHNKK